MHFPLCMYTWDRRYTHSSLRTGSTDTEYLDKVADFGQGVHPLYTFGVVVHTFYVQLGRKYCTVHYLNTLVKEYTLCFLYRYVVQLLYALVRDCHTFWSCFFISKLRTYDESVVTSSFVLYKEYIRLRSPGSGRDDLKQGHGRNLTWQSS